MQVIKSWILRVVPLQCKKQPHHILAGASKFLLSTFFTEEVQAFGITGDGISQVTWYPENKFVFFPTSPFDTHIIEHHGNKKETIKTNKLCGVCYILHFYLSCLS